MNNSRKSPPPIVLESFITFNRRRLTKRSVMEPGTVTRTPGKTLATTFSCNAVSIFFARLLPRFPKHCLLSHRNLLKRLVRVASEYISFDRVCQFLQLDARCILAQNAFPTLREGCRTFQDAPVINRRNSACLRSVSRASASLPSSVSS